MSYISYFPNGCGKLMSKRNLKFWTRLEEYSIRVVVGTSWRGISKKISVAGKVMEIIIMASFKLTLSVAVSKHIDFHC